MCTLLAAAPTGNRSLGVALTLAFLGALTAETPAAAQGGHSLVGDRIVVDSAEHWRAWSLPTHAVDVSIDGVAPHRFRQRYNLLDDRQTFTRKLREFRRGKLDHAILNIDSVQTLDVRGEVITKKKSGVLIPVYTYLARIGISRVGTNPEIADAILDADPTTFWEPDLAADPNDWWIEVDLGRVVVIDSLVLHFVDEDLGEPFRQFRVLVAPNQAPVLEAGKKVSFALVARTTAPNVDQRDFSFTFEEPDAVPEWTGRMVETLRIIVTESRGGRGTLVSEEEWLALDPADRGDIVYYVRALEGFEEPESRAVYESLEPERQGRKEFYRRERPRLADIEVWGYGDNISLGIVKGGGNVALSGGGFSPAAGFDGDYSTDFVHPIREKTALADRGLLSIDMGATFWLDAMRMSTIRSVGGYLMNGSDGTTDTSGRQAWRRFSPLARENIDPSDTSLEHWLDSYDPPPRVRHMEMITFQRALRGRAGEGPQVSEYQLFSHGYPAEVVLTSDIIEVPPGRMLGGINWRADAPSGTEVQIRTRTGNLRSKVISYFDKSGSKIPQKNWKNLLGSFRGPVDTTLVVGSDWSNWSRLYEQPGEVVTSPAQRSLLQVQVKLRTEDRFAAASIRSLDIELLEPNAESLLAELWPPMVSAPGRPDTFEVFIRPLFVESPTLVRSKGFDELMFTLAADNRMELLELEVGVDEGSGQPVRQFRRDADGFADAGGARLGLLGDGTDTLRVRLPDIVHSLPASQGQRLFHRVADELEQVPVTRDGQLLTAASYGVLAPEERGDVFFFRREQDEFGSEVRLIPVDEAIYDGLEEQARATRYFRILLDEGGQFPFDAAGDTLDQTGYFTLPVANRGRIVAAGPLLRLQFAAPVFVNGTTLEMAVRNTSGGTDLTAPWQGIESGDATSLVASETLTIQVPLDTRPLDDVVIGPNPFTPNNDGINDETQIGFSVLQLSASREVAVRVFTLDGRRVWQRRQPTGSGRIQVAWTGEDDAGRLVPPGIYICQIELDVDEDSRSKAQSRLIHVVY